MKYFIIYYACIFFLLAVYLRILSIFIIVVFKVVKKHVGQRAMLFTRARPQLISPNKYAAYILQYEREHKMCTSADTGRFKTPEFSFIFQSFSSGRNIASVTVIDHKLSELFIKPNVCSGRSELSASLVSEKLAKSHTSGATLPRPPGFYGIA